ncbi:hypothetical protein BSKO_05152 [Bryopsis sp. KO-2023]|nr:hypothetical protein BSKO_05152 [Bryopsis sp. KO-2023]
MEVQLTSEFPTRRLDALNHRSKPSLKKRKIVGFEGHREGVRLYPPVADMSSEAAEEDPCQYSLHVANLHTDVDEAQLIEVFKQAGPISSIRVCRDAQTLKSLGYAYINFRAPAGAATALGELNYTVFKGQAVCLTFANPEAKEKDRPVEREGNIFVKGFDPDLDAPSLHKAFSEFGEVLSVKISQSEDGQSLGYGFVQFKETKSAAKAIELASGSILRGRVIKVAHFVPKKERGEEKEPGAGFKNVYVKNLPLNVREDADLRVLFEDFGEILSVKVAQSEAKKSPCHNNDEEGK